MSRWSPRMTVSAVIEKDGRYVFVEEEVRGKLKINQPAGHLEENEDLVTAVKREVLEETGCHFEPEGITGLYLWRTPERSDRQTLTFMRVNFFGRVISEVPDPDLDVGIERVLWLTPDELRNGQQGGAMTLRSPMVTRCVDDYLGGRRYPLDVLVNLLDRA